MVETAKVQRLVADTASARLTASRPERKPAPAHLRDLEGLQQRASKAAPVPAIVGVAVAAGAWCIGTGRGQRPLLERAQRVAEHLVERHGPETAKQLAIETVTTTAQDPSVRDVGAVVAHRLHRLATAGSGSRVDNINLSRTDAPPQAHRAALSLLIGAHGAGDTKRATRALAQLVEVGMTTEQVAQHLGIEAEALATYQTTREVRTA